MKTLTKLTLAALGSLATIGCDPFKDAVKGPPEVISGGFTSYADGTGYEGLPSAPGVVTATGIPSTCYNGTPYAGEFSPPPPPLPSGFVFVKFNKLLDGASIQTSLTDCTPVPQMNLVVTINGSATPPGGLAWYACYVPQAPVPTEGAAVFIFLDDPAALKSTPGGWDGNQPIVTSGDLVTVLQATGTVHDKDGAAAAFGVTVDIDPDPGTPGRINVQNIVVGATNTDYDVTWTASQCAAPTATYTVERAPDVSGAPGTFAPIAACTGLTAPPCHETVANNTIYWYRVKAVGTEGPSRYDAPATQKPAAPAAPTFPNFTATSVDVNWTATPSAVTYNVQRALDVNNAPGTFADLATGLTVLTYTDSTLTTGTKYWYRIVAVNPYGSTNGAAATQVPAAPAVPVFTNVTSTSLTVSWRAAKNAVTYNVQRAQDVSGSPGTFTTITTVFAPIQTYNDSGLTAATRYWYRIVAVNPTFPAGTNGVAGFVTTAP